MRVKLVLLVCCVLLAMLFIASQYVSFFVVQPLGMAPKGVTLVMKRTGDLRFIDSADAICLRRLGGVNLLCRGMVLGQLQPQDIYARWPYSDWLYLKSTGGVQFR